MTVIICSGTLLFAVLAYFLFTPPVAILPNPTAYIAQAQHHLRGIKSYWDQYAMQRGKIRDPEQVSVLQDVGFEMEILDFESVNGVRNNRVFYVPASLRKMKESKPEERILFIYRDPFEVPHGTNELSGQRIERYMAITAYSEVLYLEDPPDVMIHLFE